MASKRDYYDVLGVNKSTPKEDVKKAYRKLAMQYHPDRNPGNAEAEAKFKEATEAANVLLDDSKRQRYEQFGHAGVDGQGGGFGGGGFSGDFGDLGDIFGDIFGDFMGGGGRRQRGGGGARGGRRGADVEMELEIKFQEAAFGVEKEINLMREIIKEGTTAKTCPACNGQGEIRRQQGFFAFAQTCPQCGGSGEFVEKTKKKVNLSVKVPAGIDNEQRLKISGEGHAGSRGGPNGDLYVHIRVKAHEIFERDGADVYCEVPISFSQAALGADVEVPTLSGKVQLKVTPGTQSGKKMRLKGKGITKLGGYGLGDQIILLMVETPTHLSSGQRELFAQLAALETSDSNSNPMSKGFFEKVRNLFQ